MHAKSRSGPSLSARRDAHGSASGFAPISPRGNGTIIISSTGPNDVALDRVGHAPDSPFATAFATAISEPGLEIRDVFDRVEAMVDHATNHQQQPWIAYSAIGRFYFGAPARAAAYIPNIALDDGPFHCPAAGTTVTLDVPAGAVTGAYEATDPADPVLCRIVTTAGESKSLLYNFYDAGSLFGPGRDPKREWMTCCPSMPIKSASKCTTASIAGFRKPGSGLASRRCRLMGAM